ncbi:MAG: thioredoxin domain-containing protein [Gammaproteobacteria bacterium]|nr:thioredoxin domain-containing protein [Gammaproteobacteria bacterium]
MNRLARETSPYLRQHADNPVDWYPWGEEAIDRARAENLPILLSIGYSSCHWCHVMAHESFEDEATARVMNARFVNIKVDREERPDLDRIYQLSHQLLTRQGGGWPLTVFIDPPTLLPFFTGTYFPRQPRHGLPGFTDLLMRISERYAAKRDEVASHGEQLAAVFANLEQLEHGFEDDDETLLASAREQLAAMYDASEGGFGSAPKFPMPTAIERLLRHWARVHADLSRNPDREALNMVMTTLTKMARGGIYDHLGGGFCRYSTDRHWMIPHFEKMLYDNGALLALYSDALGLGSDVLFADAVRETAGWMMREMQHCEGGYFAAQDADSEGVEGKFYVWRRDAVKRALTEDEYLVVETLYGLDKPPNFEGKWNLHRRDAWRSVVERLYLEEDQAAPLLASAKTKLFAERAKRPPPGRDEKVLAAWNGLAIHGMAKAGTRLGEPSWVDSAGRAADFVRTRMVQDGRLFATWNEGQAKYPAYLDDYANMLQGILSLLSAQWRDEDLDFATYLGDELLERFQDPETGAFFFTAHDHEKLIHRPKPTADDAMPPGNGVAARALLGLGHLLGEPRYMDAAERTVDWARGFIAQHAASHCTLLTALEEYRYPAELVIVRGPRPAIGDWLAAARAGYRPSRLVYGIPDDAERLPAYLPRPNPLRLVSAEAASPVSAYLCNGLQCSAPITDFAEFKNAIA